MKGFVMKTTLLTFLFLASVNALAMVIPEVKGQIQNYTDIASDKLKVIATLSCQARDAVCGESVTSESTVTAAGKFHLLSVSEKGWDFGRRALAYQIVADDQILAQVKDIKSEDSFKKLMANLSLHGTPALNQRLRLATGKKGTLNK